MIENNYDLPHTRILSDEARRDMKILAHEARSATSLPLGICCLWNDWKAALDLAHIYSFQFIRIPVFVDHIETHYGYHIQEDPAEIIEYRTQIGAEQIKIIVDIHVKHSTILNTDTIEISAKNAVLAGADGIIVTGRWTADMPDISDLEKVRKAVGENFPILVGSGTTKDNITSLLEVADTCIVGTALKSNSGVSHEINVRTWEERIDQRKVEEIINRVRI